MPADDDPVPKSREITLKSSTFIYRTAVMLPFIEFETEITPSPAERDPT